MLNLSGRSLIQENQSKVEGLAGEVLVCAVFKQSYVIEYNVTDKLC